MLFRSASTTPSALGAGPHAAVGSGVDITVDDDCAPTDPEASTTPSALGAGPHAVEHLRGSSAALEALAGPGGAVRPPSIGPSGQVDPLQRAPAVSAEHGGTVGLILSPPSILTLSPPSMPATEAATRVERRRGIPAALGPSSLIEPRRGASFSPRPPCPVTARRRQSGTRPTSPGWHASWPLMRRPPTTAARLSPEGRRVMPPRPPTAPLLPPARHHGPAPT